MQSGMTQTADPTSVGELSGLIDRLADEVARDETRLRQIIIDLVEAGRSENAVELLRAWNTTAAGDLLKKIEKE